MRRFALAVLALTACGHRSEPTPADACRHIADLCGVAASASSIVECTRGWTEVNDVFGAKTSRKYLECTMTAQSCGEFIGCTEGAAKLFGRDIEDTANRIAGDTVHRGDDSKPLPAECKQADRVCAQDEPFARDDCSDMLDNIRADKALVNELVACYARVTNCYAFKDCTDDMWRKLH